MVRSGSHRLDRGGGFQSRRRRRRFGRRLLRSFRIDLGLCNQRLETQTRQQRGGCDKFRRVLSGWNFDPDAVVRALGLIILSQSFPETVRFNTNDGIALLIEIGWAAEGV